VTAALFPEEYPDAGGEEEFFPTPQPLAGAIVRLLHTACVNSWPRRILEPSAGTGNFVGAARSQWPGAFIQAVDTQPRSGACCEAGANGFAQRDVVEWAKEQPQEDFSLILGNPPFSRAAEHIAALKPLLRPSGCLAFYLRISFFEWTRKRTLFWRDHPLWAFAPIAQRASHYSGGTDSVIGGLFVWRHYAGNLLLPAVAWR
jgi:hypothetical protein